jgi:cytochrome d ubiquinol oxidase subunit I
VNRFAITIPHAGSLILTHSFNGRIPGLDSAPPADRPPVLPPFFAFRIMVGIGLIMIAAGFIGMFLWWRRQLIESRWFLWLAARGWWLGFVAVICGWIVTETGRQPWVATGILRTADANSPVSGLAVAVTLALFVLVYGIVFAMGIYYINRLIVRGPRGHAVEAPDAGSLGRPISAAQEAGREALAGGS